MNTVKKNVAEWTRTHSEQRHPLWWGILALICIECVVIATFLVSFYYLWIISSSAERVGWPPQDALPPLAYPSISLFLLFLCGLSMWWGGVVMERGEHRRFAWLALYCCTAGALSLYFRWLQCNVLPFRHDSHAYGSFVWTLTGFHFFHVLSAVLGTAAIGYLAARGYYTAERRLGIQVDTMYWYFVVAAWVPVYFSLYIAPRLTG